MHRRTTPGGVTVWAGADYGGAVRAALVAHKEHGQLSLVRPLARLLTAAIEVGAESPPPSVHRRRALLVPAPSWPGAVRERGQDHAERLARRAAALCTGTVATPLTWARRVNDQSGLGVGGRRLNVAGAMAATPPHRNATVWLVDDIVTSGATVDEGVRALTAAGWSVAGVAVVASVASRPARPAVGP